MFRLKDFFILLLYINLTFRKKDLFYIVKKIIELLIFNLDFILD